MFVVYCFLIIPVNSVGRVYSFNLNCGLVRVRLLVIILMFALLYRYVV